ncbi:MAG: hypothetical protein U0164_12760 [Gemmatimonadaceae bacterium]
MLRLVTLGGLSLDRGETGGRVDGLGPKALLVLGVLSRAGAKGVSRERLKSWFWPESDAEHAAQVLRQTLYAIRRAAGDVVQGSAELRLDLATLSVDSLEFEELARRDETEPAIAAYAGPFLDGVPVKVSAELEHWIDRQRAALAALHRRLLLESARRGGLAAAETQRRWLRATDGMPLDIEAAEGRIRNHLALGDRIGAVRFGADFARRVRRELDVEPPASFATLLEQARLECDRPGGDPLDPQGDEERQAPALEAHDPVHAPTHGVAPTVARVPAAWAGKLTPSWWRRLVEIGTVFAAATVLWGETGGRAERRGKAGVSGERVFVLRSIATSGGRSEGELAEAVSRLLAVSLDGVPGLRVVHASDVGSLSALATAVSDTSLSRRVIPEELVARLTRSADGTLQLDAVVHSASGTSGANERFIASVRGQEGKLFALVDSLAFAIVAQNGMPVANGEGSAARSTASLPALRAFIVAERLMRDGRHAAAVDAYQQALAHDSAFSLASYRLSEAADWIGNGVLMLQAIDRAYRHRACLSMHDRKVVEAGYHWRHGAIDEAELLLRETVKLYPGDAESWYQLGEVQFHSGPYRGRAIAGAVTAFRAAFRLDPSRGEALTHLARIAGSYHDRLALDSIIATADSVGRRDLSRQLDSFRHLVVADPRYTRRLVDSLRPLGAGDVLPLALSASQYAINLRGAAEIASLLVRAPHTDEMQRTGALLLARIQVARGQSDLADRALQSIPNPPAAWILGQRALLIEVPSAAVPPRGALTALRDSLLLASDAARRERGVEHERHRNFELAGPKYLGYVVGLLDMRLGDTSAVRREAEALRQQPGDTVERALAGALSIALRARLALAARDTVMALRLLESINPSIPLYDRTEVSSFSRERYLRATLLAAMGREDEALSWFESLGQGAIGEIAYLGSATEARARLLARLGERELAKAMMARLHRMRDDQGPGVAAHGDGRLAVRAR